MVAPYTGLRALSGESQYQALKGNLGGLSCWQRAVDISLAGSFISNDVPFILHALNERVGFDPLEINVLAVISDRVWCVLLIGCPQTGRAIRPATYSCLRIRVLEVQSIEVFGADTSLRTRAVMRGAGGQGDSQR